MQQKNKKLKICFFTIDFPPMVGGIVEFSRNTTYHVSESSRVEHVQVIALNDQVPGIEVPNKKLTILRDNKKSFLGILFAVCKYAVCFRDYDVFHATTVFPLGFIVVFVGKYILRKPVFVLFYGTDMLSTLGSKKTRLAKAWTLRHATKAIAPSYSTRDRVAELYSIKTSRLPVVYYPFPDTLPVISEEMTESLKGKYNINVSDFIVLYMGHLVKRKGGEDIIRAIALVKDPEVKLIMVNDGPERRNFENLVKDFGIQNQVIFTGKVPDPFPMYSLAHIFSMPSFFDKKEGDIEGLGVVYLEAQHYGIPILGTRSGGIPEAVDDGKSGFLVPERDPKALAEKIVFLKKNPHVQKQMGAYGKRFVHEKFNWRKSVSGHIDLYSLFLK